MSNLEKSQSCRSRIALPKSLICVSIFLWKFLICLKSFCLEQLGINTKYSLKKLQIVPHIKQKNPSVLRLCPFDVTNLRLSEVCPLRIPNRQPPLAVTVGQFQRLQCLVVKHSGIGQGHSHSLCQTHMGTRTAEASCGPGCFIAPCPHSPRRRRRRAGCAAPQHMHHVLLHRQLSWADLVSPVPNRG